MSLAAKLRLLVAGLVIALGLAVVPASVAFAAAYNPTPAAVCASGNSKTANATLCSETGTGNNITGVNGILLKATRFLAVLTGVASIIMIIIGGIRYTVSSGDPQAVGVAKSQIIYAVVGLIISLIAQSIIVFVLNQIK